MPCVQAAALELRALPLCKPTGLVVSAACRACLLTGRLDDDRGRVRGILTPAAGRRLCPACSADRHVAGSRLHSCVSLLFPAAPLLRNAAPSSLCRARGGLGCLSPVTLSGLGGCSQVLLGRCRCAHH